MSTLLVVGPAKGGIVAAKSDPLLEALVWCPHEVGNEPIRWLPHRGTAKNRIRPSHKKAGNCRNAILPGAFFVSSRDEAVPINKVTAQYCESPREGSRAGTERTHRPTLRKSSSSVAFLVLSTPTRFGAGSWPGISRQTTRLFSDTKFRQLITTHRRWRDGMLVRSTNVARGPEREPDRMIK